ncbi:MAG: hypothetical protein Kow00108_24900 [Calditrichia bacterium]
MTKYIYIFTAVLLFGLSCTNPFSLRDPEAPGGNSNDQRLELQLNPDSLMSKLKLAFLEKNNQLYSDLFASGVIDSVYFMFKPTAYWTERFVNWDYTDETIYFDNMVKQKSIGSISIKMASKTEWFTFTTSPDSLQARYEYHIQIQENNSYSHYRGESIFKIYRANDSYYRIYYWEDLVLNDQSSDSTWSALKTRFRINE